MRYVLVLLVMEFFSSCLMARENAEPQGIVSPEMVLVEAGNFQMGSDEGGLAFERPRHPVVISQAFFISRYEITNEQVALVFNWGLQNKYLRVSQEGVFNLNGEPQPLLDINDRDCQIQYENNQFRVKKHKDNHPCIEISWYGAVVFCNILNLTAGEREIYDLSHWTCNFAQPGYRLPTESEWEYAASGGKKSLGNEFAGGNRLEAVGWYEGNSNRSTHPAGLKKPNELGIYDMSGNVWEWCEDWHDPIYYFFAPERDPVGPPSGKTKVIRGGSWNWGEISARVKSRLLSCDPAGMGDLGGFRVVRTRGEKAD